MSLRSRVDANKSNEETKNPVPKSTAKNTNQRNDKNPVNNKTSASRPSPQSPVNNSNEYDLKAMKNAGLQVMASFEFAKAQYTRSLGIVVLSLLITICVIFETYYVFTYKPPIKYIPVYEDSTLIDPIPLNQPFKSDAEMRQWLADASKDIFSYDYLNVDTHGARIKKYFTEKGYSDFMSKFKNSPDIPRVKNKKMEVISSSIGSPAKLHEGDKLSGNNFAYWEYRISVRQVFISPNEGIIPVTYDMVATIVRQDQRMYRDGIAIHSFRTVSSNNIQ